MEWFTKKMASEASGQLFQEKLNVVSSYTNRLPKQLKLEGQSVAGISTIYHPSGFRNEIEGKSSFLILNFQTRSIFAAFNPLSTFPLLILWKPYTSRKRRGQKHNGGCITVMVSRKNTLFHAMSAIFSLKAFWAKEDLTNKSFLTAICAYFISR